MLAAWKAHGIDGILREAWERGIVLAGSMCWFEGGVTASFGSQPASLEGGPGLPPGSNWPHDGARRDAYMGALRDGLAPGLAAEDGVALHFVDRRLAAVVASREGRRAYRVGVAGARVIEAPLRPVLVDRSAAAPTPLDVAEARPALAAAL